MQGKSINIIIMHINRINDKSHMIISRGPDKAYDEIKGDKKE
jgi:hypothetical protein